MKLIDSLLKWLLRNMSIDDVICISSTKTGHPLADAISDDLLVAAKAKKINGSKAKARKGRSLKSVYSDATYDIVGRGLIKVVLEDDYRINEKIFIDGVKYNIRGIERAEPRGKICGLIVRQET